MAARPYISAVKLTGELARNSYLMELPVIRHLRQNEQLELTRPVTFFAGENGTGKSTLLEAIAVAYGFNPEGGTKNFNFSTEDSHSELWQALTLVKRGYASDGFFLRAESFYNAATYILSFARDCVKKCLESRINSGVRGISEMYKSVVFFSVF